MNSQNIELLLQHNIIQGRRIASYYARQEIEKLKHELSDDLLRLEHFGYKVYSQNDEDGIIEEIARRLGVDQGTFVEIGVENGLECNTHYLLHKGWRGAWIEGNPKQFESIEERFGALLQNGRLEVKIEFVYKDNLSQIFERISVVNDGLDFLSIDIDGNDIHLLESLPVMPKFICIEYNSKFPPHVEKRPIYEPNRQWAGTDYMGSSLLAVSKAAKQKGYTLVGTNLVGLNAFFVRDDLVGSLFTSAGEVKALYNPPRYWLCVDHYSSIGHQSDFGPYEDLLMPRTLNGS